MVTLSVPKWMERPQPSKGAAPAPVRETSRSAAKTVVPIRAVPQAQQRTITRSETLLAQIASSQDKLLVAIQSLAASEAAEKTASLLGYVIAGQKELIDLAKADADRPEPAEAMDHGPTILAALDRQQTTLEAILEALKAPRIAVRDAQGRIVSGKFGGQ